MNTVTKLAIGFVAVSLLSAMWVQQWVFKKIEMVMPNKPKNSRLDEDDECGARA